MLSVRFKHVWDGVYLYIESIHGLICSTDFNSSINWIKEMFSVNSFNSF